VQVSFDGGLAVAAVGGDRGGHAPGAAGDPRDGGDQLRAVRDGAAFHAVVHDDAVVVVDDLGLVPELDRFVDAALAAGRASGSCRLTSRVAPSGICPASRDRAWATTVAVRSTVTASLPSARRSRPRIRPLSARPTARRPLRSTAAACAAAELGVVREQPQHHLQAAAAGAQQRGLGVGVDEVGGQLGGDLIAGRGGGVEFLAGGGDFLLRGGDQPGVLGGRADRRVGQQARQVAFRGGQRLSASRTVADAALRAGLSTILVLVSMPAM
jgi:hypothetical protein